MRTKVLAATTLAASLMLAACGGGSSASTADTLSGVAAVGVPIVGGHVNVACAGGSALSATTDSSGAWQVTISGQTLPCALEVSGGTVGGSANGTPYHSIALSFDTVNITPLTDLVVANLAGKAPAVWFAGINAAALNSTNSAAVSAALQKVIAALGLGASLNGADPLTARFSATSGNAIDDILEALAKARVSAGLDYSALLALAAGSGFSAPENFNFSGAYAAVQAAGGAAGTCMSGETALIYSGNDGLYTKGQTLCFSASPTNLAFSGKTLKDPVLNGVVAAPFAAYTFTDTGAIYEVILKSGALYEINVVDSANTYGGQFSLPAAPSTGTANLQVQVTSVGLSRSIPVSDASVPSSQNEFCNGIPTDKTFLEIGESGGGKLTMTNCSFANKVGTVKADLNVINLGILPYTITYTYQ